MVRAEPISIKYADTAPISPPADKPCKARQIINKTKPSTWKRAPRYFPGKHLMLRLLRFHPTFPTFSNNLRLNNPIWSSFSQRSYLPKVGVKRIQTTHLNPVTLDQLWPKSSQKGTNSPTIYDRNDLQWCLKGYHPKVEPQRSRHNPTKLPSLILGKSCPPLLLPHNCIRRTHTIPRYFQGAKAMLTSRSAAHLLSKPQRGGSIQKDQTAINTYLRGGERKPDSPDWWHPTCHQHAK